MTEIWPGCSSQQTAEERSACTRRHLQPKPTGWAWQEYSSVAALGDIEPDTTQYMEKVRVEIFFHHFFNHLHRSCYLIPPYWAFDLYLETKQTVFSFLYWKDSIVVTGRIKKQTKYWEVKKCANTLIFMHNDCLKRIKIIL